MILKTGQHSKYLQFVFTELGIAMLSSVLKSDRAVQVNIPIMRAFIHTRQMYISHEDLKCKIMAMEGKYNKQFQIVFEAINQLLEMDEESRRKIGYAVYRELPPEKRERNNF